MAPDENDKKDLEVEGIEPIDALGEDDTHEEIKVIDPNDDVVDLDIQPDASDDVSGLSAGGAYGEDDFDQDLDIDITGDENIDFADEPAEEKGGGGNLKKVLAPALVLVIAAGIGGYIVMNPQILGGGNGVPEPAVAYKAPEPSTFSTEVPRQAPDLSAGESSFAAALPQPTVNQNEIPRGPDVTAPPAGFGATEDVEAAEIMDVPNDDESPFDLTEPDVEEVAEIEMPEPPTFGDDLTESASVEDVVPVEGSFELTAAGDVEEINAEGSRAGDVANSVVVRDDDAQALIPMVDASEVKTSEPASGGRSIELAQAEVTEAPAAVSPVEPLAAPVAPAPSQPRQQAQPKPQAAPPQQATSPQSAEPRPAAETFYDGVVPKGPMAEVGPRKIDPKLEPAMQYVVVKKNADINDMEAQLVAANRALQLQRYESALEIFNRLYEKNSRDPRILMGRAVAQQNSGLIESAIRSYEQLLEIDPKNADATLNMLGLLRQQYPSVALRRLLDLYENNPDNAGIAAQIGVTQADLNDYPSAMRYLGIAASLEPQNAQHVFNMAIIADRGGHTPEAISYYEQALRLDAVYASGRSIPRETVYDRLATLRKR